MQLNFRYILSIKQLYYVYIRRKLLAGDQVVDSNNTSEECGQSSECSAYQLP